MLYTLCVFAVRNGLYKTESLQVLQVMLTETVHTIAGNKRHDVTENFCCSSPSMRRFAAQYVRIALAFCDANCEQMNKAGLKLRTNEQNSNV